MRGLYSRIAYIRSVTVAFVACCCLICFSHPAEAQLNTYVFSTGTGAVMDDMTTGVSGLLFGGGDDVASGAINIGFNFTFNGVSYSQFSVNTMD